MSNRKALLIGINYVGSQHALEGCHQDVRNMMGFLESQGYRSQDCVVLMDSQENDPNGQSWPSGANILQALQWLVNSTNKSLFLHYSGHGGQVRESDGTGINDTIVPVDFETNGQIDSSLLHQNVVTPLGEGSMLHCIFDCCHSGSAMELPYVYRTDDEGNVNVVDNIKQGIRLATSAAHLLQGGFSMDKVRDAEQLYAGAQSLFKGLEHMGGDGDGQEGLGDADNQDFRGESRRVIMYSGCRDDQTSADAAIAGSHVGAMSWAFLESMKRNDGQQSYVDILRNTREVLRQNYSQVPQLSCGEQLDLNQPFQI